MLYDKLVLDKNGVKTSVPHTWSPDIGELPEPAEFFIIDRIPVATKNQNKYTNDLPIDAENTDRIKTPIIITIGA